METYATMATAVVTNQNYTTRIEELGTGFPIGPSPKIFGSLIF